MDDRGRSLRRIRLLAVQTGTALTPEARVLRSLLTTLPQLGDETGIAVDVLLIQGVDGRGQVGQGDRVAREFRQLPNVTVHELEMGRLGQQHLRGIARLLKVGDLMNLHLRQGRLLPIARDFRPHLVYSAQQLWDARIATPLARQLSCPQIVHLHYTIGPWLGQESLDMLRQVRMVIGVSEFIRDDAIKHGVPAEKARFLYNSVVVPASLGEQERADIRRSVRTELALPDNTLLVGMVARLSVYKGQEQLMQAMAPILPDHPHVHLVFAGDEAPGTGVIARIKGIARDRNVISQVHLLGYRSDVPRLLDAIDVFAHPSRSEPFSLAILEAMAHALPVVAWREGGPAELIIDGDTGILVESMDKAGLTQALQLLLDNARTRTTMGGKGRNRVLQVFSPEVVQPMFLALLQDAVEKNQSELETVAP